MATLQDSGTQSATVSTEHTLATITSAGTYVLQVDMNALANGDTLVLRGKVKVLSGGTTRQLFEATFSNAQADANTQSIPIPSVNECVFTLQQTGGTGRSFPWQVIKL